MYLLWPTSLSKLVYFHLKSRMWLKTLISRLGILFQRTIIIAAVAHIRFSFFDASTSPHIDTLIWRLLVALWFRTLSSRRRGEGSGQWTCLSAWNSDISILYDWFSFSRLLKDRIVCLNGQVWICEWQMMLIAPCSGGWYTILTHRCPIVISGGWTPRSAHSFLH